MHSLQPFDVLFSETALIYGSSVEILLLLSPFENFDFDSSQPTLLYTATTTLILILGRIILGRYDETPSLACPPIHHFDNVDKFLFVGQCPIDLVVVTRTQIDHDVFVAIKEHGRASVVPKKQVC